MTPTRSREEIAKAEIGQTEIGRGLALLLTVLFLLTIIGIPVGQALWEVGQHVSGQRISPIPQAMAILRLVSGPAHVLLTSQSTWIDRVFAANRELQQAIGRYEEQLENESGLTRFALPPSQRVLSGWLGAGNEKAYCGQNGWLFYRPSVDYVTGPGFLEPRQLRRRSQLEAVQPDPLEAIHQFNQQLGRRGIQLVVMPVPVKPMVHPERFAHGFRRGEEVLQNPSYARFVEELEQTGVLVFDVTALLSQMRPPGDRELFLRTDTHWRPETMVQVAQALSSFLTDSGLLPPVTSIPFRSEPAVVQNLGDIAAMLQLPRDQTIYPPEEVRISQVLTPTNELWQPSEDADIIVLGDSFSNVYSLGAMGWGEAAGFVEQLSYALQRPVDCILRNDNGAFSTREILRNQLNRGRDRLKGKRVVVYQFAVRELAVGDWRLLDLKLGTAVPSRFFCPPPGHTVTARATVASVSPVPKPGSVPYRDHILAIHLIDLELADESAPHGQAVVYLWSMQDNVLTDAAHYHPGQTVEIKLLTWSDVSDELDRINRSELQDQQLMLQEPCWGEPVP
jgi:alginate O-acetyltransferase complex protein AlgJ